MKIILGTLVLLLCFSCNNEKPSTKTEDTKTEALSPEDQKWMKIGYDLTKGKPKGLTTGTKAPDFELTATDGSTFKLSAELKKQPVVMLFYRGQWCPVCHRYLTAFMEEVPKITATGAKVIAVAPETNENIKKIVDATGINFSVMQDPDYKVMKAYDVLFNVTEAYQQKIKDKLKTDIAENNGKDEASLPVPATYVIGQDGTIKYVQFDLNYKNRASVKEILEHLK